MVGPRGLSKGKAQREVEDKGNKQKESKDRRRKIKDKKGEELKKWRNGKHKTAERIISTLSWNFIQRVMAVSY